MNKKNIYNKIENKKDYTKIYNFFSFLKVASIVIAALYSVFWFYRFFNLPFTDIIYPVFDFFITPIKQTIETQNTFNGAVIEMGYFIMAVIMAVVSYIFSRIELIILELQRRSDLAYIRLKKQYEEIVNKELKMEYANTIEEYKYFSCFVRFKNFYVNEVLAQNAHTTIQDAISRSYANFLSLIMQKCPSLNSQKYGSSIFIRGEWNMGFDDFMENVLDSIRIIKKQNANDVIGTDFMLILDAQITKEEADKSYETFIKIADGEYYNKALCTPAFKLRFDLIKDESPYTTDMLGYSISDTNKRDEDSEIYILKTKPKKI